MDIEKAMELEEERRQKRAAIMEKIEACQTKLEQASDIMDGL